MKIVLILLLSIAAVLASNDIFIDWNNVKPIWEIPEMRSRYSKLIQHYESEKSLNPNQIKPFVVGGEPAELNQFTYTVSYILCYFTLSLMHKFISGTCNSSFFNSKWIL